jgi:nicotinamidase-related amidase
MFLNRVDIELYPLLIIDAVKGCCGLEYERPEWNIHFSRVRKLIPRLNNFAEEYRGMGGRIIWVKPTPWTVEYLPENINRLYRENPQANFYVNENVEGYTEFPPEIEVMPGDIVVEKNSYSAFTNSRLIDLLNSDIYLVAGVYADGCVNATIVEGWSRGLFTFILSDLVESMDDPVKQGQKNFLLSHGWPLMYGHVMTSREFLSLLDRSNEKSPSKDIV